MKCSRHAQKRQSQRAIPSHFVELAVSFGRVLRSHGDLCYLLDDRSIRLAPGWVRQLSDRLRGLCVIVTPDNTIRTTMWRNDVRKNPGVLRKLFLLERSGARKPGLRATTGRNRTLPTRRRGQLGRSLRQTDSAAP